MGSIGKTAAEIAAELGVTRQAVYKRLHADTELQDRLQGLTTVINGRTYYPQPAEIILKTAFVNRVDNVSLQDGLQEVDKGSQDSEPSLQNDTAVQALYMVIDELRRQLDALRSENTAQREQLTVKDNQITALQATIDGMNAVIQQNARTLEATANALTAAQALHAADKKQLMELDAPGTEQPHTLREKFRAWRNRKRGEDS